LPLTFEFITAVSFKLFPEKFALQGFEYPDSNRVNRGLLQLGPKYRNWARGKHSTGWAFTREGEAALAETAAAVDQGAGLRSRRAKADVRAGSYTLDLEAEVSAIHDTAAYKLFNERGPSGLRIDDVWEVVGAFAYTPADAIRKRLRVLGRLASDARDDEATRFLDALTEVLKTANARGKHA
jgi:hypothetical protein